MRWQSPHACTMIPDTAECARSCAWMIAEPRKNLKADSDIRSYRSGIRPGIRSASVCSSSFSGSCEGDRGFHSASEVRGHFSRSAFPCLRRSTLDNITFGFIWRSVPQLPADSRARPLRALRRTWRHESVRLTAAASAVLVAGDTLILQNPHYYPAVVGLSFRGRVRGHLPAGAHGAGRQDVRQRDLAMLFEEIRHVLGALRT